jgi:putative transposase
LQSDDVLSSLAELFVKYGEHGPLKHIRLENGSEMSKRLGVQMLFIEPGSPWENRYNESCNGKFRDERLNGQIIYEFR